MPTTAVGQERAPGFSGAERKAARIMLVENPIPKG